MDIGTAHVAAMAFTSPLLKLSMYWRTAANGFAVSG
jgi:hypothetical protein